MNYDWQRAAALAAGMTPVLLLTFAWAAWQHGHTKDVLSGKTYDPPFVVINYKGGVGIAHADPKPSEDFPDPSFCDACHERWGYLSEIRSQRPLKLGESCAALAR